MKRTMARSGGTSDRLELVVRWTRRALLVVMVFLLALIFRRYEFEQLDDRLHGPLKPRLRRGAFLIYSRVQDDTLLGRGSIVEAIVRVPGPLIDDYEGRTEGKLLSEIRGAPGETISFERRDDGWVELVVQGERTFARMRPRWQDDVEEGLRVREGPIPPDRFLLIHPNADDHVMDSRRFGLVPRRSLLRKATHL